MRDLDDEKRIKEYMEAKMKHIKMYNECMNLADGLDVAKFAELVRADEREKCAKREWVGLTKMDLKPLCDQWKIIYGGYVDEFTRAIEAKLKEKNGG
jgi:hypothetical protein